jgi:DNA-binding response OmpR family regulator
MKRRILLVDDEVAILLTLKAVLEISGFEVETAASAREAKMKIRTHEYHMVITDMRMESDSAGTEVVAAAKNASYRPAVAMLTAFPLPGSEGEEQADELLVKPMNTSDLLRQLEALLVTHEDSKGTAEERKSASANSTAARPAPSKAKRKAPSKAAPAKPTLQAKSLAGKLASAR